MPIIRSLQNNFEIQDWTEELLLVPNLYGVVSNMGLFSEEGVATHTANFEMIEENIGLIKDTYRGTRNYVGKDYKRSIKSYYIPHFTYDDAIRPEDIQGKTAYGGAGIGMPETLDGVRLRRMQRLRNSFGQTLETARMRTLVSGDIFAPNGTVSGNFYTDFNVTRKNIDFALGNASTEVVTMIEQVIAHIQDNAHSGEIITEIVALVSPTFFTKLISHASVKTAYKYYKDGVQPLRDRLSTGLNREFDYLGIRFVEYRGYDPEGVAFIPDGEAYFFPMGTTDIFKTYYGPANRFDLVNTIGVSQYMFEYVNMTNTEITIQGESNFINLIRKPQLVVRGYTN